MGPRPRRAHASPAPAVRLLRRALTPPVRSYIRYFPLRRGKWWVYWNVADRFLLWEPHRFSARTVFGARVGGQTTDILHRYLYWFGAWEPQLTHFLSRRLSPGDTFVDVGANVGYFSLLAAKLVGPDGRVVAVEASPAIHRQLVANLERNSLAARVRAVNVAAGDRSATVPVFHGPAWHEGLSGLFPNVEGELNVELGFEAEVPALPLAELLREQELATARVVKIDVEGAEAMVVDGLGSLLGRGREDLEVVVEIGPARLAGQDRTVDDILATFSAQGFVAYRLENSYRPWAYLDVATRPVRRLRESIVDETDLVFSRVDAEEL